MDSKFVPGDYVKYENDIYLVKSVLLMNPDFENPFVCGLIPIKNAYNLQQMLVMESLLEKVYPPFNEKLSKAMYEF